MSLQVWLPLNGSLENKGLANLNLTATPTYSDNGKIGSKCLSSQVGWFQIPEMTGAKQMTFAYWVRLNEVTSTDWLDTFSWYTTNGTSSHRSRQEFYYSTGTSMTTGVWYYNSSNSGFAGIEVGEWNHFVFTIDYENGISKFYKNGSLLKITTNVDTNYYVSGNNFLIRESALNTSINDFRLYDNILSEKEIKQLSQGLVLHLPLNNNGLGQENLLNDLTLWNKESGVTINWDSNQQMYKMVVNKTNNTSRWGIYQNFTVTPNTTYTLSVEGLKGDHTTSMAVGTAESSIGWPANRYTFKTIKTKGVYTFTSGANDTVGRIYLNLQPTPDTGNKTAWFLHPKLELGDKVTPWSPNPTDEDYPASGSGIPENLFAATDMSEPMIINNYTDWTKHFRMYNGSAAIHTIDTTEMTDTIALTTYSNLGIAFARLNSEINLDPNEYYTISCEAKCTNTNLKLCIGLSYYNDQSTWVWRGGSNAKTFTTANTWQKITHTFKPDANTYAICYCFTVNPGASPTGTDTFSIRKCKLEKGSTATEWQPSPIDDSYKTLGYYNNIEHDTSGYNYNAIKHGILSYSSDAPKYNVSTKIITTSTGIKISNFYIGNIWTMSVWFKYPSLDNTGWKALVILNNDGGDADIQLGNYFNCNDGRIQYSANGKYNSSTYCTAGVWHHLVNVYDGTVLKGYLDGVQKCTITPGQTLLRSNLGIGLRSKAVDFSTTSYSFTNGQISDVRIYATALSEKDVKSLYNNNAYIDSNDKIYGKIR